MELYALAPEVGSVIYPVSRLWRYLRSFRPGSAITNVAVASRPVGLYNRLRAKRKQRKEAALYR